MAVTDYHKGRTIENIQKGGTMEFLAKWFWYTGKQSCESRSGDCISTYQTGKGMKIWAKCPGV